MASGTTTAEMLVHKQLRDVLLTQRHVLTSWKEQAFLGSQSAIAELQLSTLYANLKFLCEAALIRYMYAMQMQTDQKEVVTRIEYDVIVDQWKEERRQHEETKARLAGESAKLQFALGEIEVLTGQLEREKANFEHSFGQLKEKSVKENAKNSQMKTRFSAIEAEKQKQDDILSLKDSRITDLKQRLAMQRDNHRQQVSELNVQLQQEAYITRTLNAKGNNRKGHNNPGK